MFLLQEVIYGVWEYLKFRKEGFYIMSELLPIWDTSQLAAGANNISPFTIPNNPNARTLKINNQSRYWLLLNKVQSNVTVDRIEPFSYIVMPYEPDLGLAIDTTDAAASSLNPDLEFVDYSYINGIVQYMKGSTQFSGSSAVSIAGDVQIGNSQLDVSIVGNPTMNLAPNSQVEISGTPVMNINSMPNVTVQGGSIDVSSATIINDQLPVSFIYNAKTTFTVPANTTNNIFTYQFLPNGTMANVHHIDVYIVSANGVTSYSTVGVAIFANFSDGHQVNASAKFSITHQGTNSDSADGQAVIGNILQLSIGQANATTSDTITVYLAIDTNETAIGTTDGVYVKPFQAAINDASGSTLTANVSQQVLGTASMRRYIFFQNISDTDMYIKLGNTGTIAVGGAGTILIPANGGSFVMEGSFVSNGYLFVICSAANKNYTCMYY